MLFSFLGVSLVDIERILDKRALKIRRRQGDAKPETLLNSNGVPGTMVTTAANNETNSSVKASKSVLRCYDMKSLSGKELQDLCKRPAAVDAAKLGPIVKGIIANVCSNGDRALLELTEKFDKVKLASPIIEVSSVQEPLLESKVKDAIDLAYENIFKFHKAQLNLEPMVVETCKGVICSRHPRPIEKVIKCSEQSVACLLLGTQKFAILFLQSCTNSNQFEYVTYDRDRIFNAHDTRVIFAVP